MILSLILSVFCISSQFSLIQCSTGWNDNVVFNIPCRGNANDISSNHVSTSLVNGQFVANFNNEANAAIQLGISRIIGVSDPKVFKVGQGDFTLSTWMTISDQGMNMALFTQGDAYQAGGYAVYISGQYLRIQTSCNNAPNVYISTSKILWSKIWNHVAMTVTRGEKIRLYFNGLQIAESVVNSTCDLSSKEALFVGYDMHYDKNFYGSVANIRMHNESLSPTTINQLYQWDKNPSRSPTEFPTAAPSNNPTASPTFEPTQTPSLRPSATPSTKPTMEPSQNPTVSPSFAPWLAAAYRLDGNWQDSVNLGSAMAAGQIVWVGDRFGTPSTAAQFDGQSFVWGNNPSLPIAERTVVAWVKLLRDPTVSQGGEQNWTVVSYGGGGCGQGFLLSVHENGVSGRDGVEVQSNCGQDRLEFQTRSLGALVGSWMQLAVASSRSGTVLYVNGSEVASSDVFMVGTGGRGRFVLGGQLQGDGSLPVVGSFRGLMDNVAWYNRALTTREINGLFADQPPTVATNNFQIMKSGATELSLTMVFGSASDSSQQSSLVYSFKNIRHGYFSVKSEPSKSITSFSHERLMSMGALFTVDGSGIEPTFEFAVDDGNLQSSYVQANVVVVTSFAPSFRPSIAPTSTTNSNPSSPASTSDDDASHDEVSNRDLIIGLPLAIGASVSAAIIWYVIRCLIKRNRTENS